MATTIKSKVYAIVDEETGKLVSNLTNPRKLFWAVHGAAKNALNKYYSSRYPINKKKLRVVVFTYDPLESSKL